MPEGLPALLPVWTLIIALAVFLYVLLDGFDLGVGILYGFAPQSQRNAVMSTIAPIWDGNETWLILGGLALLAVFPLAFSIIIPAVYFPVLLMLLSLVFRGVSFEFRFENPWITSIWERGFCVGSALAAFAQGAILGAFIQGFTVQGRVFAGSSWDWFTPFSVATGISLVFGYGLLGAGWLIIKTEGELHAWARGADLGAEAQRRADCRGTYARGDRGRWPRAQADGGGCVQAVDRPEQRRGLQSGWAVVCEPPDQAEGSQARLGRRGASQAC